jgi:two-component sensor histidine kinase
MHSDRQLGAREPLRWLIGKRAVRALVIFCLVSALSFALSAALVRELSNAQHLVIHTREVQSKIDEVAWDVLAIDAGLRGFALTGDEAQLDAYMHGESEIQLDIAAIDALTRGDPEQQELLAKLRPLAEGHLARAHAAVAAGRAGDLEMARNIIRAMGSRHLSSVAVEMHDAEDDHLVQKLDRERRESDLVLIGIGISGVLALGLVGVTALLLNRALVTREAVLREKEQMIAQKDLMMREIDHRIRNSLTLVHSLLAIQKRNAAPAVQNVLGDAASRVMTIARVHEHLYRSAAIGRVELAAYLEQISDGLRMSLLPAGERGALQFHAMEIGTVAADQAVPLGLLMTELVTNAIKYGAPSGESPIEVSLNTADRHWELVVTDHGPGLPDSFTFEQSRGLGMQVIRMLVEQLQARLEVERTTQGARFVIVVPKDGTPSQN